MKAKFEQKKAVPGKNASPVENGGPADEKSDRKVRCKSLVIDGTKYRTMLNMKFENRVKWDAPNPKKIMSTIPGTIIKIFVKKGQKVKEGDPMLILEAMKMRNKIFFHAPGTIKSIRVKEGEKVPKNHLMVELA